MKKLLTALLMLFSLGAYTLAPAQAQYYPYDGYGYHPYIQKALIGGGIGAVAGSLLGTRDPVGAGIKGAVVGSAAGMGYQYLKQRSYGYGGYGGGYGGYGGYGGGYGPGRGCGWHGNHGRHRGWR